MSQFDHLAPPFNGEDDNQIIASVKRGVFRFKEQEWSQVSTQAKDLITKMLEKDPKKRISAVDALNDPWILTFTTKEDIDLPLLADVLSKIQTFRVW